MGLGYKFGTGVLEDCEKHHNINESRGSINGVLTKMKPKWNRILTQF